MPFRLRPVLAFAVLAAALAVAPAAQATLVFVRDPLKPVVWVGADDGSGQRRLAAGSNPHVSPDGRSIAYERRQKAHGYRPELMVVAADGSGSPRRLLANWSEPFDFDWSPDSSTVAAVTGPPALPEPPHALERGHIRGQRLMLIDVASGARRAVALGFFSGVSFSPDGSRLVYGKAERERFPLRSDVYRADVTGGAPVRLTHDRRSLDPFWSPVRPPECVRAAPPCYPPEIAEQIVFVKQLGAKRRRYGPKNELYLMGPGGEGMRRLTHTRVDPLLWGLTPIDWSADGTRLLAEFGGQDTSYAVTVDASTGAQRTVGGHSPSNWFVGAALSSDDSTILGSTGGFEPGRHNNVVSAPYGGGRPTVLARNAFEPNWSR